MEACLPAIYLRSICQSLARYWAWLGVGEWPVLRSFSYVKQSWDFFTFVENVIVTGWLVPSAGQKILVQLGCYLPPQKIPLVMMHYNFFTHSLCK
jgi:hypothetical protein